MLAVNLSGLWWRWNEERGSDGSEECRNLCSVGKLLLVNSPYVPPSHQDRQTDTDTDAATKVLSCDKWQNDTDAVIFVCNDKQVLALILYFCYWQGGLKKRFTLAGHSGWVSAEMVQIMFFLSMGNSIEVILINDTNDSNHRWLV